MNCDHFRKKLGSYILTTRPTLTHPYLQEGGANERLLLVDGSRTENVTGPQVQWDMLNHICQKLEVFNVTDEIHPIHLREADKDVLGGERGGFNNDLCDHFPHTIELKGATEKLTTRLDSVASGS